jgi:hypothetical protein
MARKPTFWISSPLTVPCNGFLLSVRLARRQQADSADETQDQQESGATDGQRHGPPLALELE